MTRPGSDTVTPPPRVDSGGATTAASPGRAWTTSGAAAAIHHKTQAFDELERVNGLPVNQAGELDRLRHAVHLCAGVAHALKAGAPYREQMIALGAHAARWIDHLDAKASESPTTPPRRAPDPELVRRVMRDTETPR